MKNLIIATVAVIAVSFAATNKAEARSKVRFSFGNRGLNVSVGNRGHHDDDDDHDDHNHGNRRVASRGHNHSRTVFNPYRSRYTGYRSTRYVAPRYNTHHVPAHTWHDTSHWDYTPATVRRHGNHYDYTPARYDFHREGHVDHNHH